MTLNFPNRLVWLLIGIVMLFLMQGGCKPIQPPTDGEPIAEVQATETGEETARANFNTDIDDATTSPDGKWTASTLLQTPRDGGNEYYQRLIVSHVSGSPSYTLVDSLSPWGLGYTVVTPLTWSQDGKRFYYTNRAQADGCGILYNGSDLYQVDLASGETTEILPANTTTKLGLAPDEQHIAYLAVGEPTLLIRDLKSDESIPFDLTSILDDHQAVGAIVWSPDSSAIAFVVAHNPCSGGWAEATTIYVLDVATLSLTTHLEHDDRLLIPVAWPSEGTLLVENQVPYDQIQQKRQFTLDLATDTVTQ